MLNLFDNSNSIKEFIKNQLGLENFDLFYVLCSLTHKSFLQAKPDSKIQDYDSLEFLGDALISWIISQQLFSIGKTPATLTKLKSQIIQSKSFVLTAKKIGLDKLIRIGPSLQGEITDSIIEDVFESFTAAVFLTFGLKTAEQFVAQTLWKNFTDHAFDSILDYKTQLQELVHKKYKLPVIYTHISKVVAGKKMFVVTCKINKEIQIQSEGTKLKSIENECAKQLIQKYWNKGK